MAFNLDYASLNALLAKGFISNEFYDKMVNADNQKKAVEEAVQNAPQYQEDQRLAKNEPKDAGAADVSGTRPQAPPTASDATSSQPNPTVNSSQALPKNVADQEWDVLSPDGRKGTMTTADIQKNSANGINYQIRNTDRNQSQMGEWKGEPIIGKPVLMAPTGPAANAPPGKYATLQDILPAPRAYTPPSQVAGGQPQAPVQPTPQPQPTAPVAPRPTAPSAPAYKGPGNPLFGPPDMNKMLSPGEVNRIGQINQNAEINKGFATQAGQINQGEDAEIYAAREKYNNQVEQIANERRQRQLDEQKFKIDKYNELDQGYARWAKKGIDPDEAYRHGIFGDNVTANKILGGIAIALGALGQGATMAGGHGAGVNQGMQAIDNAINTSIAKQKFALQQEKGGLDAQRSLYNDRLNQFKDEDLATAASMIDYWNIAEKRVQAIVAKNKGARDSLATAETLQGIEEKKQQAIFEFSNVADARARAQAAQAAAARAQASNRMYEDFKARRDAVLKAYGEGKITNPDGSIPSLNDVLTDLQTKGAQSKYVTMNPELAKLDVSSRQHLGDKIAPLAETQKLLDNAKKDYQKGGPLEGLSAQGSLLLSASQTPTAAATPQGWALRTAYGDKEREADQRFGALVNKYIHDTTGAALNGEGQWEGGNSAEAARLFRTIKGDGSASARQNGMKIMEDNIAAQRESYLKGATPGAAKAFTPPPSQEEKDKSFGFKPNK